MVSGPVPVLVRVAVCGLPDCPTVMPGQVRDPGEMEAEVVPPPDPPSPAPERETCCGLLIALSIKLSVAALFPEFFGLKRTVTEQLAEAEIVKPHVFWDMEKSDAPVPEKAIVLNFRVWPLLFVTVTVCDPPTCPTVTLPQLRDAGETITCVWAESVLKTAPHPVMSIASSARTNS